MSAFGIYPGICVNNADPEKQGRITANVPQVLGGVSDWAQPCWPPGWTQGLLQDHANDGGHSQYTGTGLHSHAHALKLVTPAPGTPVWIMFIAGDIDHPVWIGVAK